ncbi:carbamoyltransferase [Candidatus Micrarchaeota archaeon]|nr:carbamoyltransferase [Candidatus Micrarchaeota archaeon]
MNVLGISCYYHDSAAALIKDGIVVAAAQEERFTRKKHDEAFPKNAIDYCLREGRITLDNVDCMVFYEKPFMKFDRIMEMFFHSAPSGVGMFLSAMPAWLKQKLWMEEDMRKQTGFRGEIKFTEHHLSHAASAFYASPFKRAAILTVDGVGEWATATMGTGSEDGSITMLREIRFPHSLGLLYSAFTAYLGFKVNSGEYKVMGLAPHGKPTYYDVIMDKLIDLKEDGSFRLNMDYFSFMTEFKTTNEKFNELFGGPPRTSETEFNKKHYDLARSIQAVTEEVMLKMTNSLYDQTKEKYLCMAGGVALNCVANGRILRECPYEDIYIQPAAGDAGGSVGCAAAVYNTLAKKPPFSMMNSAYLGPAFSDAEIEDYLKSVGASYTKAPEEDLLKQTARWVADKRVVGWFQGRMEFGPRALGARSILADPTDPTMKDTLNAKIKLREGFRPFAPTVTEEKISEYFDIDCPSPYMLLVANTRPEYRSKLPAITHVDGTARIQSVSSEQNRLYHGVIKEFGKLSGVEVVVNTSYNIRGEPLVCTPGDAYACFMRTGMEALAMGSFLMAKEDQHPDMDKVKIRDYELD